MEKITVCAMAVCFSAIPLFMLHSIDNKPHPNAVDMRLAISELFFQNCILDKQLTGLDEHQSFSACVQQRNYQEEMEFIKQQRKAM